MFCGAKYTHHTFTPIIKHLITTANKHPGKRSFIDRYALMTKAQWKMDILALHKLSSSPPSPQYAEYRVYVNTHQVSAQGVDEHMIIVL